jgi:hypothetical protein
MYAYTLNMVTKSHYIRAENLAVKQVQMLTGSVTATLRDTYRYCDMPYITAQYAAFEAASAQMEVRRGQSGEGMAATGK